MGAFKLWHIIVVLIVLVVLFGANRLPNIAKNVGQSAKVLKKEMRELTDENEQTKAAEDTVVPPVSPAVTPEETVFVDRTDNDPQTNTK